MNENCLWSFGYGSNMDVEALEKKKHVKILDHTPAILRDFRMSFSLHGINHVEPAYANIIEEPGECVHGVAFCMSLDSVKELDGTERGYNKKMVTLESYDGRKLNGFVYISKQEPKPERAPSARYLGVLIKGAKQAGLKEEYILRLSETKTYTPPEKILSLRRTRPEPSELRPITIEELAQHRANEPWVSCLGYVIECGSFFGSHKGRDITTRVLMQYHGIPLDDNDDGGRPPYPIIKELKSGELEYITCWLDHYHAGQAQEVPNKIIGYLKEFNDQQDSGSTTFELPSVRN